MRKGKGGEPTLYETKERGAPKLFDMEKPMTPEVRSMAERAMGDDFPEHDIDGKPITTLRQLFDEYRSESANNGLTRDEVQETFDSIRYNLENRGYNGYRHIGGEKTGKKTHEVHIYWTPEDHLDVMRSDINKYRGDESPPQKAEENPAAPVLESHQGSASPVEGAEAEHVSQTAASAPLAEGIPLGFLKKVQVDHTAYNATEKRYEKIQVPADRALASVRADIEHLEALLKCMKG
jgi:hypothetical protein